jgi:ParB-like nuclease domain/DNA methylase
MTSYPQVLQIESWAMDRLVPYARNARTHSDAQIAQIAASIAEFGFNHPVLVDPEGGIIAGHGRVLALRQLSYSEVPVIVLGHLNPNQKRAFMLADNKLALNAGWDEQMLRVELEALAQEEFPISLTGFEEEELERLLAEQEQVGLSDPDEVPAPERQAITLAGDLWQLGPHRVLCADATHPESLRRVLDGACCDLVFTDLPYNVDYTGKGPSKMKMANDNLGVEFGRFLEAACRHIVSVSAGPIYLCMSSSELHRLHTAFRDAGGHWSTYIIWAKSLFTLGRSDYQRQYEPILYGWREGTKHFWCGARNQSDVWFVDKPRVNDLHPTMKQVELVERAIENSSRKADVVLDPLCCP